MLKVNIQENEALANDVQKLDEDIESSEDSEVPSKVSESAKKTTN